MPPESNHQSKPYESDQLFAPVAKPMVERTRSAIDLMVGTLGVHLWNRSCQIKEIFGGVSTVFVT